MHEIKLIDKQWVEIIPPTAPFDTSVVMIGVVVFLFATMASVVYILWRRQPRPRAARTLFASRNKLKHQPNNKKILFFLAEQLRAGFQVSRLDTITFKQDKNTQWCNFLQELQTACYKKRATHSDKIHELFSSGIGWLKQSPVADRGKVNVDAV